MVTGVRLLRATTYLINSLVPLLHPANSTITSHRVAEESLPLLLRSAVETRVAMVYGNLLEKQDGGGE